MQSEKLQQFFRNACSNCKHALQTLSANVGDANLANVDDNAPSVRVHASASAPLMHAHLLRVCDYGGRHHAGAHEYATSPRARGDVHDGPEARQKSMRLELQQRRVEYL